MGYLATVRDQTVHTVQRFGWILNLLKSALKPSPPFEDLCGLLGLILYMALSTRFLPLNKLLPHFDSTVQEPTLTAAGLSQSWSVYVH